MLAKKYKSHQLGCCSVAVLAGVMLPLSLSVTCGDFCLLCTLRADPDPYSLNIGNDATAVL